MTQNPGKEWGSKAGGALMETEEAREAARLIAAYLKELGNRYSTENLMSAHAILQASERIQIQVLLAIQAGSNLVLRMDTVLNTLLRRNLPWTAEEIETLVKRGARKHGLKVEYDLILQPVQRYVAQGNPLTSRMDAGLRILLNDLSESPHYQGRIQKLLGEETLVLPDPGESWTETARADILALPEEAQRAWKRLFAHAQNSDSAKPTSAWRKEARVLIAAVGEENFRQGIARWFGLVTIPPIRIVQHEYVNDTWEEQIYGTHRNLNMLKGLAWMCNEVRGNDSARALAKLTESCLRKPPGSGPWASRIAMAAIWALAESDSPEAIAQLGRLKTKVAFRPALKAIEKGLETAAKRAGVSKADLEDLSVPTYGFGLDGVRREEFGECAANAIITTTGEIEVAWFGPNDKPVKSVPAAVKKDHAAALKEFKADMDAAGKMLTAQKARFDGFFLPERVWNYRNWNDRFAAHTLLSHIARRLIWHFSDPNGAQKMPGIWNDAQNAFVDVRGTPLSWLNADTQVRLWHPIGFSVEEVVAWRNYLHAESIVQPFKQAYREVYLLTEAELGTHTYSNRFAGHILKQHQMNSLAALRGWKNKLRLLVDDAYPPASKELPDLGLRAEFWIEGLGDNYDTDTTESGVYLYLTTDQVRFYPLAAAENYAHAGGGGYTGGRLGADREPVPALPLMEVSALAFSEIMRDVDMFVGVCSVGNDPTWQDGGVQGQYRDYWADYSFGNLSATAQTRHAVLTRLLPRLKIASRCHLTNRFLVVRGDLRTYNIHLSSGNILMEPNDQYLCIVQDRSGFRNETPVNYLPFEGDQRLAVILSKAFLLAEDKRIKDPTILRQIKP